MIAIFWRALRTHVWLRLFVAALMLSSIGNGLTFLVTLAELQRLGASPLSFAFAFTLATVPGLIGSTLGERQLRHMPALKLVQQTQWLGLAGLALPVSGLIWQSLPILQLAEGVAAFSAGMALPAISQLGKQHLSDAELPAAAAIDTLAFSCYVLFGVGIGTLLYRPGHALPLLLLDAASYLLAIALLGRTQHHCPATPAAHQLTPQHATSPDSPAQRRALWLLPALGLVGAPAMALLPVLAPRLGDAHLFLPLLFIRSLGQLCGPLLVPASLLVRRHAPAPLMTLCLLFFVGCYLLLPLAQSTMLAFALVFCAHIASNIVFTLGWTGLLRQFDAANVGRASATSYRRQVMAAALSAILAGVLSSIMPVAQAFMLISGINLMLVITLLRRLPAT